MGIEDYYSELPEQLIDAFAKNKCILFVGAGISRMCLGKDRKPLPNWYEFLSSFAIWQEKNKKLTKQDAREIKVLISKGKYLLVAEELLSISTEQEFNKFLNNTFEPKTIFPSILHELIVALPFRGIITSNYDNLIEQAYFSKFKRLPKLFYNKDILSGYDVFQNKFFILKLHGDIEDPKSIILSQKSYANLIYNSQEYRNLLEHIFLEHTILLIGYGGSDPDIEATYDKLSTKKASNLICHFMLARENSLSNIEKKRFRKDRGITVIEYVDYFDLHNHIYTFMSDLAEKLTERKIKLKSNLPIELRSRIFVAYDQVDTEDGIYLREYFFKNGAIISRAIAKHDYKYFTERFHKLSQALDCLIIFIGETILNTKNRFYKAILNAIKLCKKDGIRIVLVSSNSDKGAIPKNLLYLPIFYVPKKFIDKDLVKLKDYLGETINLYSSRCSK
jgi:hypothetical protein